MARKTARPGRTLALLFLAIAIMFGGIAFAGTWKPELGLDLRGGTEISMTAKNTEGGSVPRESLEEAKTIIDQRVNGSGITGGRVTTEGNDVIKVSIPGTGKVQQETAERVRQTAKLRFRLVACSPQRPCGSGDAGAGGGSMIEDPSGGAAPGTSPRAPFGSETVSASEESEKGSDKDAKSDPSPSASASAGADSEKKKSENSVVKVDDAVKFMRNVPQEWATAYSSFTCPTPGSKPAEDIAGKPLLTCDDDGMPYLLTPAVIEGTEIKEASYGIPQQQANYVVTLDFKSDGNKVFADTTGAIAGSGEQFAIVLDAKVISAPTADSRISGGAQISGDFTQETAAALANNLKYGSLPLDFPEDGIQTRVIGPTLAGNQLTAGLWAGLIGMILVVIFSVLYYRAMAIVVIGSLAVAGALTYGMILLLSETAGVTLDLPGVAGLIVGIGITADSFIILYERMRDDMREGRSMRVAVDTAWVRARNTCLASDAVSFLAAFVLYVFATNEVKGFAFMLGLTTIIDVLVFFWLTHPLTKLLAGWGFFNKGHVLSGMDKRAIGTVDAPTGTTLVGGKA
ncbi:preprotein translocase subunit SecD [Nocardioides luteus]|uniref:Protein translocase subunit SecD n=1 Tax=Nocardioides luteus TaxID=1844 RepID=A0ABQ5SZS0_9ACTN|nr:protein translocase subunit SecD [Nocardioides luteus]MDR7310894.1 preprotein translocase subunit SecD [Nocardioides luteus]GGR39920.1 protein translocase subunit SecD [Nocardioides luteus]GLJ69326.1 protein translocase subunit SecD [Nocardioides luteus]